MKDCSKAAGRHINRETVIFDCTNMGWHRKLCKSNYWIIYTCVFNSFILELHMPALQFIRAIADCDQKYYPETLNKFFLVNAPGAFVYVWKIVKAWLDPGVSIINVHVKRRMLIIIL